jgi:hypothetical protein
VSCAGNPPRMCAAHAARRGVLLGRHTTRYPSLVGLASPSTWTTHTSTAFPAQDTSGRSIPQALRPPLARVHWQLAHRR